MASNPSRQEPKQGHRQGTEKDPASKFSGLFSPIVPLKYMDQIVGMAQLYFMPHPLLEIVQRLMAHPVFHRQQLKLHCYFRIF